MSTASLLPLRQPLRFVAGFRHAAKGYCQVHSHPDLEIVYHVRGTGHTELLDGRQFSFTPRSVIIYGPGVPHDQTIVTRGEDACIHIALPPEHARLAGDCLSVPPVHDAYLLNELMLLSNIRSWKDPADEACLNHRVTALLLRLIQLASVQDRREGASPAETYAERAREIIHENFKSIGRIESVAQQIDVSYDYLRHVYKRRFGVNIKRALMQARIEEAKKLLVHSPLPQKAIAEMCGFANERYFSTSFRNLAGMTAGEYRTAARGKT